MTAAFCSVLAAVALTAGNTEIVVAPTAPKTVRDAAAYFGGFLGTVLDGDIPVVTAMTPGKVSVVLGTNDWSRAAGLDPTKLRRDGFRVRTVGNRVFICGCDDPKEDMRFAVETNHGTGCYERGTYNGCIGFLERYAGVRFYFPGELGTVLPKHRELVLPDIDWTDEPDFAVREISFHAIGGWMGDPDGTALKRLKNEERYRLRFETEHIPCCHGQFRLGLVRRFAKTHPDYFALRADGTRMTGPEMQEQICPSSDVWKEIYKDAKSYFSGEDASVRGIPSRDGKGFAWGSNTAGGRYFDVMPNDGMPRCRCARCAYVFTRTDKQWATEGVWEKTVWMANRLKAEGIAGTLTQMAYSPYREIPKTAIPDNVAVMLSATGAWALANGEKTEREIGDVRAWGVKVGRKVWLWNYAGKFPCFSLDIPDVPQTTPRAIGAYYKRVAPDVIGAFLETTTDRFFFDYLNYYVFAKVAWDNGTDVEALLAEHDRLMYGAAAPFVADYIRLVERKWLAEVGGRYRDTPIGPMVIAPDARTLWTQVYSPKVLAQLETLLAKAEAAVKPGSLEARRLKLFRDEMFERLAARGRAYVASSDPDEARRRYERHPVPTLPRDQWHRLGPQVDAGVYFTAPDSFRLDSTNSAQLSFVCQDAPGKVGLKPNTRYRLSYFLKTKDVVPLRRGGGAGALVMGALERYIVGFPEGGRVTGTTDWIYQSFEMKTAEKLSAKPEIAIDIHNASGTAWYDDIRLEELE